MVDAEKKSGPKKRLVCLTVDRSAHLNDNEIIWRNDHVVGYVRRSGGARSLDKGIAYGYVKDPENAVTSKEFVGTGKYAIEVAGEKFEASVHTVAPYDPQNLKIKK